jgi:hypothetical protein
MMFQRLVIETNSRGFNLYNACRLVEYLRKLSVPDSLLSASKLQATMFSVIFLIVQFNEKHKETEHIARGISNSGSGEEGPSTEDLLSRVLPGRDDLIRAAETFIAHYTRAPINDLIPTEQSINAYHKAAGMFLQINTSSNSIEGVELALKYGRTALRMQQNMSFRGYRDKKIDHTVVDILSKSTTHITNTLSECALCGESPLVADIKLSNCSACKGVAYCGRGCQKAHWKLHKDVCGK